MEATDAALAALRRRNGLVHGALGAALGEPDVPILAVWQRNWAGSTIVDQAEFDDVARALHAAWERLFGYWDLTRPPRRQMPRIR